MSDLKVSDQEYCKGLSRAIEKLGQSRKALDWLRENGDAGHIDWITSCNGWGREIGIFTARENLIKVRRSYIWMLKQRANRKKEEKDGKTK